MGKSGPVVLTFKTTMNGPLIMRRSSEGNYKLPRLDAEAYTLWLPYGSSAYLRLIDSDGSLLDFELIYQKRRDKVPPNIKASAHHSEELPNVDYHTRDTDLARKLSHKHGYISPFEESALTLGRLHITGVPGLS